MSRLPTQFQIETGEDGATSAREYSKKLCSSPTRVKISDGIPLEDLSPATTPLRQAPHTEGAPWPPPAHVASQTLFGASSNLVLAVLGAGQLTLPYALRELGAVFGLGALVVFTLLSIHSLNVLAVVATHNRPLHYDCLESYAELVVRVLGTVGSSVCSTLIAIYAWGGAVSFMVILKEELNYVMFRFGLNGVHGNLLMLVDACVIIWPLASAQDMTRLKRVAPFGCMAALFITLVTLLCANWGGAAFGVVACRGPGGAKADFLPDAGELQLWPASFGRLAAALPLLAFALNSSWAFIPVLCTLADRTPARMGRLINTANAVIFVNYTLLSFYGYSTFCGATEPNVLASLGKSVAFDTWQGVFVLLARLSLSVQLTLALPMRFFVARRTMCGDNLSARKRGGVSFALVASAAVLAATPIELTMVLGITSSVCASMIIYMLPAVMDLHNCLPGAGRRAVSILSFPVGCFILVAGTVANLLGVSAGA